MIRTEENHRTICTELWVTLLIDGARALARSGRWTQAAEAMAAHRGIGNRLLDGRQIKIMSLLEQGLNQNRGRTPSGPSYVSTASPMPGRHHEKNWITWYEEHSH